MTIAAMAARLRAWAWTAVRPSDGLPTLTKRGKVFDALLVLALLVMALIGGEDDDGPGPREFEFGADERLALPPMRPEPFLPIEESQTGTTLFMFLVVVLPLVWRRRFPLTVLWIVLATAPLVSDNEAALRLSFYACVVAAFTAAVYSPYRIPALASLPFAALVYTRMQEPAVPTVPDDAVAFMILVPIVLAADGLRRWKRRADEHKERLSTLEREQAEALRRAAEHERARIARELHDVVTHNVSVMVIQAGAARRVMDTNPGEARDALLAVEAGGRAAMSELRHVMGLLTMDEEGTDPALVPQPGLDRLEALVQRVRDTGVTVELTTTGQPRPVPPGVELAAYRVVQEALTNTVKHAGGAPATVLVDYGPDQLRVEVTDTGGTPGVTAAAGNGRGLIGLRERLAVYGGSLHAGKRLTGGYRVTALIPLEAM